MIAGLVTADLAFGQFDYFGLDGLVTGLRSVAVAVFMFAFALSRGCT
jgi:hypothetical protein